MGAQRTGQGVSRDLVLDAGALIAYERGDLEARDTVRRAIATYAEIVVPASVLAQAWRGGPRSAPVARLLEGLDIDPLDKERAKEVGVRLGARDRTDVTDAHVVCCAVERQAAIVTSDPNDMAALTETGEPISLIPV
jgi:predicted nucleic acid-binding protein